MERIMKQHQFCSNNRKKIFQGEKITEYKNIHAAFSIEYKESKGNCIPSGQVDEKKQMIQAKIENNNILPL